MAGLQSREGRMMIDSVVWAQYINVTDRHTDSHVAIANAAPSSSSRDKVTKRRRGKERVDWKGALGGLSLHFVQGPPSLIFCLFSLVISTSTVDCLE